VEAREYRGRVARGVCASTGVTPLVAKESRRSFFSGDCGRDVSTNAPSFPNSSLHLISSSRMNWPRPPAEPSTRTEFFVMVEMGVLDFEK
jgi:hypothetical protein